MTQIKEWTLISVHQYLKIDGDFHWTGFPQKKKADGESTKRN
jgi:hypothetical protein